MLVKIHSSYRNSVAICDSNLIDKKFEEGNRYLDLTTTFFKGEEKPEEEVLEIIEKGIYEDFTFNIVGKESIAIALKAGIIQPGGVSTIQGVPVALVLL